MKSAVGVATLVTNFIRPFGDAYQCAQKATRQGKTVINIADLNIRP